MVQVKVRYFAAFREACGLETETVESRSTTVAELFAECQVRHASLQSYSASLVAINDDMADWDSSFSAGDEILFFPPVAGG